MPVAWLEYYVRRNASLEWLVPDVCRVLETRRAYGGLDHRYVLVRCPPNTTLKRVYKVHSGNPALNRTHETQLKLIANHKLIEDEDNA